MISESVLQEKKLQSDEIARKIEAFLSKGGQIYYAEIGESKDEYKSLNVTNKESYNKRRGIDNE
jgi:hypothetical protein